MNQIIYILTNESMPGYVKIGFTHGKVEDRLKQLDRTGTPLPFECYYSAEVEDCEKDEKWLHSIFADRRVRDNREFFKINQELVTLALKRIEVRENKVDNNLSKEQEQEVEEIRERKSRFHFSNYGISVGEKIVFTRDSSVIAEVVEGDKIKIGNRVDFMSNMARDLLGYKRRPQGTLYFKYNDEILDDLRRRVDDGDKVVLGNGSGIHRSEA